MASAREEILEALGSHAGQPVDYVALFMFLNTVAGGHYEDRHGEEEITAALRALLSEGAIEAWQGERRLGAAESLEFRQVQCHFRLSYH